jgi:tetratricopeptide (TPR) repeat protein
MASIAEQWKSMALAGQWEALLDACHGNHPVNLTLQANLWRVRALRALGQGEEANEVLRTAATGKLEAQLDEALQLAEELLQCAYFRELEPLIAALASSAYPAAYFLQANLARERAQWSQAIAALKMLENLPMPWPTLTRLALAWIRLKQGWIAEAESLLIPFAEDQTPSIQKLLARFELTVGKNEAASMRLERLALQQPLDWEWPVLLGAARASLGESIQECLNLVEQGLRRQPRQAEGLALAMRLRLALGDEQGAQVAMSQALQIKPWLDAAVVPLIERLSSTRSFEKAKALLMKLRKLADTPQRQAVGLDLMRLQGGKVRELARVAEALAEKYPENPDVLRSASAALLACRRKDPAALLMERVLNYNPYDKAARNNLAALYRERGDIDDALSQLRTLAEEGDLVAKVNLAKVLLDRGDYFDAEIQYQYLAEGAGTDLSAQIDRGLAEIQARRGDLNKALQLATLVCVKEPTNPENWILQAKVLSLKDGASAATRLLASVEDKVDAPLKLHHYLYELLRWQLRPQELVVRVQLWRKAHPGEIEYLFIEAAALQVAQDWTATEAILREAEKFDQAEGTVPLVRFYLNRMRIGAARRVAEQWVRDDLTDIRRWAQLAEVCHMEQRPEAALAAVEEGLKRDPTRLSLARQKMGILLTSNRHDEAIETMRRQWQAKGELAALLLLLDAMNRALRFNDALREVEKALVARPNERVLHLRLARQLRLVGRDEESLAVLQQLFEGEQGSDTVVKELISSLMRQDRFDEASAVMRRFAAAQPERLDLHVAIAGIALKQGLLAEARTMLKTVREQAPELIEAWLASCNVERRADDAPAEVALWQQIAQRFAPQRWAQGAVNRWVELAMGEELQSVLNRWREAEPDNVAPWWAGYEAARSSKLYDAAMTLLEGIER